VYNQVLLLVELIVSPLETSIKDTFWLRVSAAFLPGKWQKLKRVRIWELSTLNRAKDF
jgi:hypothetical protein